MRFLSKVVLTFAVFAGCKGGQGDTCNSGGPLGPLYCDQGLICNEADGDICEAPGSRQANQSCSSSQLCATGLWCATPQSKCVPWLMEGDACSDPFSCGPDLICGKPPMPPPRCMPAPPPDSGVKQATVIGTMTLPGSKVGAKVMVSLYATLPPAGTPVATGGIAGTSASLSLDYTIVDVPAGTYFLLGFVDVDGSGGDSSTPGDYAGWYGHSGDGNPPAAANAVVPDTGTVRFDFSLVVR